MQAIPPGATAAAGALSSAGAAAIARAGAAPAIITRAPASPSRAPAFKPIRRPRPKVRV